MAAATRSIELDPTSAAGHTALACATLLYENNRAMAKQEFERALALGGRAPHAGSRLYASSISNGPAGSSSRASRKPAARSTAIRCPVRLDAPLHCLCTAGRLDEAIETARRAVQQDPESFVAR